MLNIVKTEFVVPRSRSQEYNVDFEFEIERDYYNDDEDLAIEAFEGFIKHFNEEVIDPLPLLAPDIVHWDKVEVRKKDSIHEWEKLDGDVTPAVKLWNFKRPIEITMTLDGNEVSAYSLCFIDKYPPSVDAIFCMLKIFIKCFRKLRSELKAG